jgi:hypothetical protein
VTVPASPYGVPPLPPTSYGSGRATGKQVLSASWQMLRQDRELVWLPALGALASLVAAGIFFVPGWFLGDAVGGGGDHSWAAGVGGVLAGAAATVVGIFFQSALVVGANQRAEGGDPTLGSCLRAAWSLRGPIVKWGLLTATVGMLIRALEQRFGFVASIIGFLGGLAWAIASFLAVPVLVAEGVGPIDAVKRSSELIKRTWGTSLRTTLRFGAIQVVLSLACIVVGVVGAMAVASGSTGGEAIGIVMLLAAVAGFLAMAMVFAAIGGYARALIYRYASGQPVPGIDPALFSGVFQPKRRSRRWTS